MDSFGEDVSSDEESLLSLQTLSLDNVPSFMYNLFASEVPGLLALDKYHSQEEVLLSVRSRPLVPHQDVVVREYVGETMAFAREIAENVQISGRVQFESLDPCVILITRQRKGDKAYRKVFPNDECLAQVYMWLVNRNCKVKFIEKTTNETCSPIIILQKTDFGSKTIPFIASLLKTHLSSSRPLLRKCSF